MTVLRTESDPSLLDDGFYVAGRHVQPRLNRLDDAGTPVPIEPKMMQVLVLLAEHAGEPVTREQLHETVWADTVVSDDVLTRAVSELRKAFGDDPRRPRIIETIPKVGYRLIAPVTPGGGDGQFHAVPEAVVRPSAPPPAAALPGASRTWVALAVLVGVAVLAVLLALPPQSDTSHPLIARPLTTFEGIERTAALSPDGERVAFSWSQPDRAGSHLYVSPVAPMQPLRLTDGDAWDLNPVWSGDGRTLTFVRRTPEACGIYRVPALGGPAVRLAACPAGSFPELTASPDGRRLVFSAPADGEEAYVLHLLDTTTGAQRLLTRPEPGTRADYYPRIAPDGRRLAFSRNWGEGVQDLFVMDLPDGTPRRLTTQEAGIAGLDWTPDGAHLLVAWDRGGAFGLWQVPVAGGEPRWLGLSDARRPVVARGHPRLVYEQWNVDMNVYRLGPDGTAERIAASTRQDYFPTLSPDGRRLAFASSRSGTTELWASDADGSHPAPLTDLRHAFTSTPRWSPDAGRLAFVSYTDGQADLYILDRPGTSPRRLTTDRADDLTPAWSADGQWVYFSSNRTGDWQLWRIPAGGGRAEAVTTEGGYLPQFTPDGRWLYYARRGEDGLWRMPARGGATEHVYTDRGRFDAHRWAVTASSLLFIEWGSGGGVLQRIDLETGRATALFAGRQLEGAGLTASADGRTAYFVQADRADADLMLVDLDAPRP